ncbi:MULTISPECIES: hypothetical protein [unclassified Synechocystis]|uniref:hypothetical protein n=1 Tax=unclassified Synechocystis TaxID=2640012 RepID=UPI0004913E3D|nr:MULTISPECIES: hypothetical protein [unclassified Synechocystis]MCT0254609.1 hypothetical protein [Synechocystis sp. CS-94]
MKNFPAMVGGSLIVSSFALFGGAMPGIAQEVECEAYEEDGMGVAVCVDDDGNTAVSVTDEEGNQVTIVEDEEGNEYTEIIEVEQ